MQSVLKILTVTLALVVAVARVASGQQSAATGSAVDGAGTLSRSCLTYPLGTKSCEDAANTFALKNGLNIQQFNLYNTFTDVNNYERLELEGQGNASFLMGARNLGTGVARGLSLRGQITLATGWNLDASNNLKTETDSAVNIGAVGANRPLNIYAGGLLSAGSGGQINWYLRSVMQSPADGVVNLSNNLGNGFTRLILGTNDATANGFSWKLNAGNIEAWTGDGLTARATVTASALTASGLTANSFLFSGAGGLLTSTAAPTNGQLLIGSTGLAPVAASLTAGSNIVTTPGAGSLTVATSATPSFTSVTATGLTANSFTYSGVGGLLSTTAAPTNGQLLIGSTGAAPAVASLTAGSNMVVTPGAGSLTLATSATPSFTTVTTTGGVSLGGAITSLNGAATVGNGAPAEVYNTTSVAGAGSIIATTMVTPPAAASNYRFSYYLSQAAAGVGCTTNTTIAVALTYRDQNEAAAAASTLATYTITTNGAVGRLALPASGVQSYAFRTNAVAAAIQYATTVVAGTCTTAPTYQITPVLEAF